MILLKKRTKRRARKLHCRLLDWYIYRAKYIYHRHVVFKPALKYKNDGDSGCLFLRKDHTLCLGAEL